MADVDYFLKIDGIDGESQDDKHKGEIEVTTFSWGATQGGTFASGGGGGAGKVNMKDFHFEMAHNKASPKLMLACAKGDHIPKAVLTCRKAGGDQQEYSKVTMSDVLVSRYDHSAGVDGDPIPKDSISLDFSKIEVEYKPQNADGSLGGAIKAGWDRKANKPV
jgi:type VI secretion system secreted protein Hcp